MPICYTSVILERRTHGVNETNAQGLTVLALELNWQAEHLGVFETPGKNEYKTGRNSFRV
jgi:hypothetical protein